MAKTKKEIISSVVGMMRQKDTQLLAVVLTEEEEAMNKNELKAHIINQQRFESEHRLDEILRISEIK